MEQETNEELKLRLDRFIIGKIPVHIVLKKKHPMDSSRFLNGIILANPQPGVYIIDERKFGKTYLFIEDIYLANIYEKSNKTLAQDIIDRTGIRVGEGVSTDEIDIFKDLK